MAPWLDVSGVAMTTNPTRSQIHRVEVYAEPTYSSFPSRLEALEYCFQICPPQVPPIVEAAAKINLAAGVDKHDLLVVLGSGFAGVADDLGAVNYRQPLSQLPSVPSPTAEGHGHELLSIRVGAGGDRPVDLLVATGRSHLYEGLSPTQVCQLVRIAAMTGVEAAVLTNAGGCLQQWRLGDLMVVNDHLNFTHQSPFCGAVFVDIARVWDAELRQVLRSHADREGVYVALSGPEFQTLAESRWLREAGADQVGMSTVLEAVSLHQLGVRVCGLSLVSDLSFAAEVCTHEDVLAAGQAARPKLREAILAVATSLFGFGDC